MAEDVRASSESPDHARRLAVRDALLRDGAALRFLAERIRGTTCELDWLALGEAGELVSIRIADEGDDERCFTLLLSDLAWLREQAFDWLKRLPGLGIEPSAEPRGVLCGTRIGRDTIRAASNLPAAAISLFQICPLAAEPIRNGRPLRQALELEPVADSIPEPEPAPRLGDQRCRTGFRSALSEIDLAPHPTR